MSRVAHREQQVKKQRSLTSTNKQPCFKFLVQPISCDRGVLLTNSSILLRQCRHAGILISVLRSQLISS